MPNSSHYIKLYYPVCDQCNKRFNSEDNARYHKCSTSPNFNKGTTTDISKEQLKAELAYVTGLMVGTVAKYQRDIEDEAYERLMIELCDISSKAI